jgi:hypothetical protein
VSYEYAQHNKLVIQQHELNMNMVWNSYGMVWNGVVWLPQRWGTPKWVLTTISSATTFCTPNFLISGRDVPVKNSRKCVGWHPYAVYNN